MVEKPAAKPSPAASSTSIGVEGEWVGRGFYNGHSRIALRILTPIPDEPSTPTFRPQDRRGGVSCAATCCKLDAVTDAYRLVHSEGDGLSGLVVDRFGDRWWSSSSRRHVPPPRMDLRRVARAVPRLPLLLVRRGARAEAGVVRLPRPEPPAPAIITEHGVRFRVDPAGAHKTGFFLDQRDNRQWLSHQVAGKRVLDLCCNTGGFAVYADGARRGGSGRRRSRRAGARAGQGQRQAEPVRAAFVQADLFPWLRDAGERGDHYDVVVLDPAKMTRDREEMIRR